MSLEKIDYTLPITIEIIAVNSYDKSARVCKIYVEWKHIVFILEEAFPEKFSEIQEAKVKGVVTIGTIHGTYTAIGRFPVYQRSWVGYKNWLKKENEKFRFQLPLQ